tara:strand:- start:363 stop:512 length:150 start_codon:yes stop_codon:yes gene_type:complete
MDIDLELVIEMLQEALEFEDWEKVELALEKLERLLEEDFLEEYEDNSYD